jgi:hypothetical protein|tara:strand:+ start:7005 stop:7205 length:201 start_codon:yes stop_codon:yes gene_type:complete
LYVLILLIVGWRVAEIDLFALGLVVQGDRALPLGYPFEIFRGKHNSPLQYMDVSLGRGYLIYIAVG